MTTAPVTAIVVSCNEADLLHRCLSPLTAFDELIVVDMECTDSTAAVARDHGARVVGHTRVPFIEAAQEWMSEIAKNDWIVCVDPDEVFTDGLVNAIQGLLPNLDPHVAVVEVPMQYYFGQRPLQGTYWGCPHWKPGILFHRRRVTLGNVVHQRAHPRPGLKTERLPWHSNALIRHYWMRNYPQLVEKHCRYIPGEGARLFKLGRRFRWRSMLWTTAHSFAWSVLKKQGWKDGITGIGLSAFYAWYVASGWFALRRLETETSPQTCR